MGLGSWRLLIAMAIATPPGCDGAGGDESHRGPLCRRRHRCRREMRGDNSPCHRGGLNARAGPWRGGGLASFSGPHESAPRSGRSSRHQGVHREHLEHALLRSDRNPEHRTLDGRPHAAASCSAGLVDWPGRRSRSRRRSRCRTRLPLTPPPPCLAPTDPDFPAAACRGCMGTNCTGSPADRLALVGALWAGACWSEHAA